MRGRSDSKSCHAKLAPGGVQPGVDEQVRDVPQVGHVETDAAQGPDREPDNHDRYAEPHDSLAQEWNAVVVGRDGQILTIAIPSPNSVAVDAISKATGFAIYPVFSNASDLEATRRRLMAA